MPEIPALVTPVVRSPDSSGTATVNLVDPNSLFPPSTLTYTQVAQYAYAAGFRGDSLTKAVAICFAESSGNTAAHNSYVERGIRYDVWGLMQISTIHAGITEQNATNPAYAMDFSYHLSGGGSKWSDWSTYTNGAWTQFAAAATAAANAVTAAGGGITGGGTGLGGSGTGASTGGTAGVVLRDLVTGVTTGPGATLTAATPPTRDFSPTTAPKTYDICPVWHVSDIAVSVLTGDKKLVKGNLHQIPVGSTNLGALLVSCQVQLDNTQSTQVTMTFERGDEIVEAGIMFLPDPANALGQITIRDLKLAISTVQMVPSPAGRPQWQVVCIAETVMAMMNAFPASPTDTTYSPADYSPVASGSAPGTLPSASESGTEYVARMCSGPLAKTVGKPIPFYGQGVQSGTAGDAAYDTVGDPVSGTLPDSLWVYIQRLAGFFGFWIFESAGAVFWGQPHQLVEWGNRLFVNYVPVGSPVKPDFKTPVGTPKVSASIEETPGAYGHTNRRQVVRQISVDLVQWYGSQAKPGDLLELSGVGLPFDTLEPPWAPIPPTVGPAPGSNEWPKSGQRYIITKVAWQVDGGLTPVTVMAEEALDPRPQVPDPTNPQQATVASLFIPSASPTNYVLPAGIESSLTAGYRTARLPADFVKIAVAETGVAYPNTGTPDVSGLVVFCALTVGVDPTGLPRTASQLWAHIAANRLEVSLAQALVTPGALVFGQNVGSGLTWPFATKSPNQYQRVDQGWDVQSSAGATVYAVASGTIHQAAPNPGGFGNDYPYVTLDHPIATAIGEMGTIYYGHVHILGGLAGTHVQAGDPIATANVTDPQNGSAAPPGWLEIGFAQPGTGAPITPGPGATPGGQAMKDVLLQTDTTRVAIAVGDGRIVSAAGNGLTVGPIVPGWSQAGILSDLLNYRATTPTGRSPDRVSVN